MTERYFTANGVEIRAGLPVWDYDLRLSFVDEKQFARSEALDYVGRIAYGSEHFDGWFEMRRLDGSRASIMNGERMTTVHPFSGETAEHAAATAHRDGGPPTS